MRLPSLKQLSDPQFMCGFILSAVVIYVIIYLFKPCPKAPKQYRLKEPRGSYKSVNWLEATKRAPKTGDKYLVVGVGFVGRKLVEALLERGETEVACFDIIPNPFMFEETLRAKVKYIQGDVTKEEDVKKACAGRDTVYSTFAVIRFWESLPHQAEISERINVGGTDNLVKLAKQAGVKRFVCTSTAHVNISPKCVRDGLSEDDPYTKRSESHNHYTWTKAAAEQLVLSANEKQGMQTVCVRPCSGVFGARDNLMLEPALRDRKVPLLYPGARLDYVYVENVVYGHLLAEAGLREEWPGVAGEAFCVSQDQPIYAEDLYTTLRYHEPDLVLQYLPIKLLELVSYLILFISWVSRDKIPLGEGKLLTPTMLMLSSWSYTFDISKAKRVLGYKPVYTFEQSIEKSRDEFKQNLQLKSGRGSSVQK